MLTVLYFTGLHSKTKRNKDSIMFISTLDRPYDTQYCAKVEDTLLFFNTNFFCIIESVKKNTDLQTYLFFW